MFLALLAGAIVVSYGTVTFPGAEELPSAVVGNLRVNLADDERLTDPAVEVGDWVPLEGFEYDEKRPINWLNAEFEVPPSMLKQTRPLALVFYSTAAYDIYVNGKLLGHNGVPAADAATEEAGRVYRSFPLKYNLLQEGKNTLALRFSAHGLGKNWDIVNPDLEFMIFVTSLEEKGIVALEDYLPFLMMTGSIFTAAVFFFMGAYIRRKVDAEIWLAPMFAFAWVELLLGILGTLYSYPYSFHIFWMYFWFLCRIYAGVFLFRFVANRLDIPIKRGWVYTVAIPVILLLLPIIFEDFPIELGLFSSTILYTVFALVAAAYACFKRHPYGRLVLIVLLFFATGFGFSQDMYLSNYYYYYMAALSVVLFVLQAIAFEHKRREAFEVAQLSEKLELELLKSHLQPHFIMNTLSALAEWIRENPDVGVKMIHALASEFRILREIAGEKVITISGELELCNVHLELMSYRKDLRFRLETNIVDGTALVPPAIFHTLIENAMTHNRYRKEVQPFTLEQIILPDGAMQYELIAPSGEPLKRKVKTGGIGLSYITARMKDVWNNRYIFEDGPHQEGGWKTTIKIRKKETADAYSDR